MRFRLLLFIIASSFTLLFNGCKKENDAPPVFPLKFYAEKVEVSAATRMFNTTGQVTNATEIATAVNGIQNFDLEKQKVDKNTIAITFNSESEAVIGDANRQFSIVKNDKQFLFYSELDFLVVGNPFYPNNALFRAMLRYTDEVVPSSPMTPPLTREVRVAYGNYKELRLSVIAYHIYSTAQGGSSAMSGLAFNEFSPEVLTKLKNGDFIVVKEYQIVLRSR